VDLRLFVTFSRKDDEKSPKYAVHKDFTNFVMIKSKYLSKSQYLF